WGPLEPFDNSFPQTMWLAGIHSHLVSDHLHYFEDGGATYHTRFRTWDFVRGNEYDPWKAMVQPPVERLREKYAAKHYNFDSSWRRAKDLYDGSWKRIQHAINISGSCSTISTGTACGAIPRSSSPPITASCSPSTTGGARTCSRITRRSRTSRSSCITRTARARLEPRAMRSRRLWTSCRRS